MKKILFKLFLIMVFLSTISFTIVFNKNTNIIADEVEVEEEVVEPSLNIYKKNISYSSYIYILYSVSYERIDTSVNPVKMLFFDNVQEEYTISTATSIVETSGNKNIDGVDCLMFYSKGIAAKEMTDDIYARAYVEIGEETIYSEVVKYSVLEYYCEMKEAGSATANLQNLLDAMINYGAAAQINFNYKTDRLVNATYYKVSVENGTLEDGFTSGRFQYEEQVTLTAPEKEGYVFTGWTNSNDELVSTDETYTLTVTKDEVLIANYEEKIAITPVTLTLTKEAAYDATADTLDLPITVTFDYNNETVTENVTWDTTSFVVNQIGKQKLYGTLSNDSYKVDELSIEIDVLPYTFILNEETNEYTLTKYYGTAEEETIPATFNGVPIIIIGRNAFFGCNSVANIVIPESVTSIGTQAFYGCSSLTSIELPNSVTSIGEHAFSGCSSLTIKEFPSTVTNIGAYAFANCMFINCYYNGTIEKWCNIVFGGLQSNPMAITEHFYILNNNNEYYELTEIDIPNTITIIGNYQFNGVNDIIKVNIPNSVESIGEGAFRDCANLISIEIPNSVESIGESTFRGCVNLTSIEIPNSVTSIEDDTFYGCSSLTAIKIPAGVTTIGTFAFYNCESLTSIEIPNSITRIKGSAFTNCCFVNVYYTGIIEQWCNISFGSETSNPTLNASNFYLLDENSEYYKLIEIEIPNTIISIGNYVFAGWDGLKSITISQGVKSIGDKAFYECIGLRSVIFSENSQLISIGEDAFSGCSSLTSIEIPDGVTSIGDSAFFGCSSLTSIEIPNGVTCIGNGAFVACTSLTSITISEKVTSIGSYAFSGCSSLTSIEIPSSVTTIGDYAFKNCSNLTIYCEVESQPEGWGYSWNSSSCIVYFGYKKTEE